MAAALYDSMATRQAFNVEGMTFQQATLQTKNEDRTIIFEFEHGTMIAIFDGASKVVLCFSCSLLIIVPKGHLTDELSEYASSTLPRAIADRIVAADGIPDIPHIMNSCFRLS